MTADVFCIKRKQKLNTPGVAQKRTLTGMKQKAMQDSLQVQYVDSYHGYHICHRVFFFGDAVP